MNLRTTFNIDPPPVRIMFHDKVMLIGSCFTYEIGNQMSRGKMNVMMNPAGSVYNPVSVCNTLDFITAGREFTKDDLYYHDGMWLSFCHYTEFSSDDPQKTLDKINTRLKEASLFLKNSGFLFITFGTARVYRLKKTGVIVSNCHKIPSSLFTSELLSVKEIAELWTSQLDKLSKLYPDLKVIFTISPVRHLKDGAHGNQVSKSVLFLALEELLGHKSGPQYFPAYELVMDDLRDYRFYSDDMIHPSDSAINYIWEAFTGCWLDGGALKIWDEAVKISKARGHLLSAGSNSKRREFAMNILSRISRLENRVPSIDFSEEKSYFQDLLRDQP